MTCSNEARAASRFSKRLTKPRAKWTRSSQALSAAHSMASASSSDAASASCVRSSVKGSNHGGDSATVAKGGVVQPPADINNKTKIDASTPHLFIYALLL